VEVNRLEMGLGHKSSKILWDKGEDYRWRTWLCTSETKYSQKTKL